MTEIKNQLPEITWSSKETLSNTEIGTVSVLKEKLVRPDGSQAVATTILASEKSSYLLLLDTRFRDLGIVTEPGGLLIDQQQTKNYWGNQTPGITSENFMNSDYIPKNSIGIPPSNAFWQLGGFFVKDGKVISLPNDESLTGDFECLTYTKNGWLTKDVSLYNGELTSNDLADTKIGLSIPLVLRAGIPNPQNQIVARGDLRALADLRNFFDFSAGESNQKGFDFEFFDLVRKFQPTDAKEVSQLVNNGTTSFSINTPPYIAERFQKIVEENGLRKHWQVNIKDNNETNVTINGPFPANRIPVIGLGHDSNGNLVTTVVDGRQAGSTGSTFDELAKIMKDNGAINAGIGSAGGDAVAVAKMQNEFKILTSPSDKDVSGNRVTRPSPSLLVVS